MDPLRFDALARRLAGGTSRRQVLKGLGAAMLGVAATPLATSAAPGGNSAAAAWCAQTFGDTKAAGQCTSAAAHGGGPYYTDCASPAGPTCGPNQLCQNSSCVCPTGYELINGGCFQNCNTSGCPQPCDSCAGNIGGPYLCANRTSTTCITNADCPVGTACRTFAAFPGQQYHCFAPCGA